MTYFMVLNMETKSITASQKKLNHAQYKDIVGKSVILSRINAQTSSELRRKLSDIFKNGGDEAYPVHVFVSAPDFQILEKAGFRGVVKAGSNSITMLEAKVLVTELKYRVTRYKDQKRITKFAKVINRLMSAFGPAFVKEMGGYAKTKDQEPVLIKQSFNF